MKLLELRLLGVGQRDVLQQEALAALAETAARSALLVTAIASRRAGTGLLRSGNAGEGKRQTESHENALTHGFLHLV